MKRILIVTGQSGSGKSSALQVLEDLGYYCIDNLPLALLPEIVAKLDRENKLEEGYSIRAVAAQFEINKNTIVEWKKRIEIKKTRVRKPSKINDDALREDVEKYPDAYQYERAARFNCGVSSIGAALKRLNITVKKRR